MAELTNYEAIRKMTEKQLAAFLDHVYLTGVNVGSYAADIEDDIEYDAVISDHTYDSNWLSETAEAATIDPIENVPNKQTDIILKLAGIDGDFEEEQDIDIK